MNNKRLLGIASLVDKNDSIIDIGCDHAYLDIYLITNKLCKKALATDVSVGALKQAKENIKKYNLAAKVKTLLSDGLNNIEVDGYNTIVLSGMGTSTILNILSNPKVKKINKLLIQSNNNLSMLRKQMNKLGYILDDELVVLDNNKYYSIMKFIKGKEKLKVSTLLIGKYKLDYRDYYKYLFNKNNEILAKIPWHKIGKRIELYQKNIILKKYIKAL